LHVKRSASLRSGRRRGSVPRPAKDGSHMTSRLSMALVATIALASGRAYAAPGGSGVAHDDTTYSETHSVWGGTVAFGAASHLTYDDTAIRRSHHHPQGGPPRRLRRVRVGGRHRLSGGRCPEAARCHPALRSSASPVPGSSRTCRSAAAVAKDR
jgi:hypothetical protein